MTINKQDDGSYLVDLRPLGRKGKRIRKKFATKREALEYEKYVLAKAHNKEWQEKPADRRPLKLLIDLWWEHHGQTLKSGASNYKKLQNLCRDLGEPRADQINKKMFADYRAMRLGKGIKPSTLNRTQKIFSGVFTTLINSGHYHAQHPLAEMPQLKTSTAEMAFLTHDEISRLLSCFHANRDSLNAVRLCLSTGARWGEAIGLTRENVMKYKVTFTDTKNGANRTVPISKALYEEISKTDTRLLFPRADYNAVRAHLKSVVPTLPHGQAVHVLRHTFASHFMMKGGNILTLQKILGHSTIIQTMTYAHFSPDYLQDAVRFNPLSESDFI